MKLSERSNRLSPPAINWLIEYQLSHPEVISLAAGLVDYQTLPGEWVRELAQEILEPKSARKYLQYGTTQGLLELRAEICHLFESQESHVGDARQYYHPKPEDCVITTGSQQLLTLIADSLFDPGDIVLVEAPTYLVFMGVLETHGVKVINLAIDNQGIIPDELRNALAQLKSQGLLEKVKALYTVDYFQNPSNISLSEPRKKEIYDIITNLEIEHTPLIIEDAAYRDLSFNQSPNLSIKSYDVDNQHVAYTSTFSKPFSPGLKTGYGFLPEILRKAVIHHKGNHDFGSSHFNQGILLKALKTNVYNQQVQLLRKHYAEKAEIMYQALSRDLPKDVQFNRPQGGMYFWLTFPPQINTQKEHKLFQSCIEEKVLYVPGEYCYMQGLQDNSHDFGKNQKLRLSYGTVEKAEIAEGIGRFVTAVQKTYDHLK